MARHPLGRLSSSQITKIASPSHITKIAVPMTLDIRGLWPAGVEFIDENGGGPGVRLRKRERAKKPK